MVREGVTGSTKSERVRTTLTIEVETVDFDPEMSAIRLGGRNKQENKFVKVSD